ncbi:MAG: Molybdopterin molybdenumtransferase [bacterium ADurb.Bin243]|nr:MAG: Molybdopterin molybdenumtransferase [bacterium ADurb.Bin243]HOD39688.1 molybdopterin molybdotransferase MoeA [Candidatus Wallbacteria bacterium]
MVEILKDLNVAIEEILGCVSGPAEKEELFILDALDRICAEDVTARFSVPPFDTSAMDGFAVASAGFGESAAGKTVLKVIGEAAAGCVNGFKISGGEAVKIMTGAPLPAGADAILVKEAAEEEKEGGSWTVSSREKLKPGLHVRRTGADFAAGDVIVPRGARLNPAALGILASSGYSRVNVFKKRSVAVVSTGDELIDPLDQRVAADGFAPEFGRIMNSNLFLLYGLLNKTGVNCELCGIARDTPEEIAARISEGLSKADIVITTGGASVGSYDFIPDALRLLNFEVGIWKMAIKPGRPFIFAMKKAGNHNKLVFGLPGNPASSLVSFIKLLRPALYKYAGLANPRECVSVMGAISESVKKDPERTTYLRAVISNPAGERGKSPLISVPSRQDSNILTTALAANCLAEIPAGEGRVESGESVWAQII